MVDLSPFSIKRENKKIIEVDKSRMPYYLQLASKRNSASLRSSTTTGINNHPIIDNIIGVVADDYMHKEILGVWAKFNEVGFSSYRREVYVRPNASRIGSKGDIDIVYHNTKGFPLFLDVKSSRNTGGPVTINHTRWVGGKSDVIIFVSCLNSLENTAIAYLKPTDSHVNYIKIHGWTLSEVYDLYSEPAVDFEISKRVDNSVGISHRTLNLEYFMDYKYLWSFLEDPDKFKKNIGLK